MKLARYANGAACIEDAPEPALPPEGLLIRTEACGLCSGELVEWYMDAKERGTGHVLGHEVCGRIVASGDPRWTVGERVFPHHHAPCMRCQRCQTGRFVHCDQWRSTQLDPGGMAETFAVAKENLSDTLRVGHLRPQDAALIEPLACVAKSLRRAAIQEGERCAVLGLGVMGLMHLLTIGSDAVGVDLLPSRVAWAKQLGLNVQSAALEAASWDVVILCPGVESALAEAVRLVAPGGRIVLFAPIAGPTPTAASLSQLYFDEVTLIPSYSCGPNDTALAARWIEQGRLIAEQVVSHFITLPELPAAYASMRRCDILKAMVMFE